MRSKVCKLVSVTVCMTVFMDRVQDAETWTSNFAPNTDSGRARGTGAYTLSGIFHGCDGATTLLAAALASGGTGQCSPVSAVSAVSAGDRGEAGGIKQLCPPAN